MNTTTVSSVPRKTVTFLELLRCITCFLVIVNHTVSNIFLPIRPCGTWFVSLTAFFASKTAVPLFIMIAGYLMLDKSYSYQKILRSFGRFLLCLLVFSGGYYLCYHLLWEHRAVSLIGFFSGLLSNGITNAYWYLYFYLGMLLVLPFLQKMVVTMERKDFLVLFLLYALLRYGPKLLTHFFPGFTLSEHFSVLMPEASLCLLLMGCFCKRYVTPTRKGLLLCVLILTLAIAANVALTYGEYLHDQADYLFFDGIEAVTTIVATACLFYFAMAAGNAIDRWRWVPALGNLTFGIYLLSDFYLLLFLPVYRALTTKGLHALVAVVLYQVLIFCAGAVTTWVLKKIPLFRKLL